MKLMDILYGHSWATDKALDERATVLLGTACVPRLQKQIIPEIFKGGWASAARSFFVKFYIKEK